MLFSGHQTYFRFPTACTSLVNQGKRLHIVRLVIDVTLKIPKPVKSFLKKKKKTTKKNMTNSLFNVQSVAKNRI